MPLPFFTGTSAPEIEPIDWIAEGLLARGVGTILFGQPGVSKTAHTACLVAALCLGKPFANFTILKKYKVLYLDFDAGWNWSGDLFLSAFRAQGIEGIPDSFMYYSPLSEVCKFDDPQQPTNLEHLGELLEETVKQNKVDVVVVDSLGQAMSGDGDKGQEASLSLRFGLNGARASGASVLVIDHATKSARIAGQHVPTPSGSQQKRAWARLTVAIEEEANEDFVIRWSVDKSNTKKFDPFLTKLHFQSSFEGRLEKLSLEVLGDAGARTSPETSPTSPTQEKMQEILGILKENTGEVRRKDFGYGGTVDRALEMLCQTGLIEKSGYGKYQLSETSPLHQPLRSGEVVKLEENPPLATSPETSPTSPEFEEVVQKKPIVGEL